MTMENKIDLNLKIVTKNQEDLIELKERVTKLEERMTKLEERMTKLEERMTKLEERVTALEERVTSLEHSVLLIEEKHGDRIRALFDYMKANDDAHERIEKSISNLKSEIQVTLFNHEKRIKKLEGNLVPIL